VRDRRRDRRSSDYRLAQRRWCGDRSGDGLIMGFWLWLYALTDHLTQGDHRAILTSGGAADHLRKQSLVVRGRPALCVPIVTQPRVRELAESARLHFQTGTHHCQPSGATGQLGSGCQPAGGIQSAGGDGQPGGTTNLMPFGGGGIGPCARGAAGMTGGD
jgi:hypothetical protein